MKPGRSAVWLVLLALGGIACSSDTVSNSGSASGTGGAPCEDSKTARCVHVASPGELDTKSDTLPIGACCADESPCQQIVRPCPMGGPSYYYACTCEGGSWCCRLASQDGSACMPGFVPDGGWPPMEQGTCR